MNPVEQPPEHANVNALAEFVADIEKNEATQRKWFAVIHAFKRGKMVCFSDTADERLHRPSRSYDPKALHEVSQETYKFLHENRGHVERLLLTQGLRLRHFSHTLSRADQYRTGYFVEKNEDLAGNKHVIRKTKQLGPADGFVLGLLAVKTNLGRTFLPEDEFVSQLATAPQDYCQTNFSPRQLTALLDLSTSTDTSAGTTALKRKLNGVIRNLASTSFLTRVPVRGTGPQISLAPGAFRWRALMDTAEKNPAALLPQGGGPDESIQEAPQKPIVSPPAPTPAPAPAPNPPEQETTPGPSDASGAPARNHPVEVDGDE